MEEVFNNYDIIKAVKASQIRRNKAAEDQQRRHAAMLRFVNYFKKFSPRKCTDREHPIK